jgi:hypothetical protein
MATYNLFGLQTTFPWGCKTRDQHVHSLYKMFVKAVYLQTIKFQAADSSSRIYSLKFNGEQHEA